MRGLSVFGKVTIITSFLIPKLLYVSSIMETPPEVIKQMEKMVFKFLWKGPDKVTRLSVINTLDKGGLNLTDFESHIICTVDPKSIQFNLSQVVRLLGSQLRNHYILVEIHVKH